MVYEGLSGAKFVSYCIRTQAVNIWCSPKMQRPRITCVFCRWLPTSFTCSCFLSIKANNGKTLPRFFKYFHQKVFTKIKPSIEKLQRDQFW